MKKHFNRKEILLLIILIMNSCITQKNDLEQLSTDKVQVLLIGSSHWDNFQTDGHDIAKANEIDILSDKYQKELSQIIDKIVQFNPGKIFVERSVEYQPKLDSLFNLYQNSDWGIDKRNEIYQLGFRLAAKLNHKRIYGVDYLKTTFPFDSLISVMNQANQHELKESFKKSMINYEDTYNTLVREERSLKEIFEFLNNDEQRRKDLEWYLTGANRVGTTENDIGSFLASEWIKRNIYTYGLIQKYTEMDDKRIMILMGASHISILKKMIESNSDWSSIELIKVLEN